MNKFVKLLWCLVVFQALLFVAMLFNATASPTWFTVGSAMWCFCMILYCLRNAVIAGRRKPPSVPATTDVDQEAFDSWSRTGAVPTAYVEKVAGGGFSTVRALQICACPCHYYSGAARPSAKGCNCGHPPGAR
jgi:hypothetical protein